MFHVAPMIVLQLDSITKWITLQHYVAHTRASEHNGWAPAGTMPFSLLSGEVSKESGGATSRGGIATP